MSESFSTVLVKDDRLNCKSFVRYAVEKGASNITYTEIRAVSATNTSHVYNVIVPSEQTLIDRRVEWRATINFTLSFSALPNGSGAAGSATQPYDLLKYGDQSALCAYPLHSCCSVVSATINNNTVTSNMDDILPLLIRFMDRQHIHKYTATTPTMPDNYFKYADAEKTTNNPLGAYNNTDKSNDYHGRGSFKLNSVQVSVNGGAYVNGSVYNGPNQGTAKVKISVSVIEPFMMSPFIFSHDKVNSQAMYGVQNLNFKMNMNPSARIWRQAVLKTDQDPAQLINVPTIQIDSYDDPYLVFCFMTPHPEDLLQAKNVVSYMEIPRYITPGTTAIPALGSTFIPTNTIQLNSVPDKLCVMVRRTNRTVGQPDSYLVIKQISINWNNQSGILATAPQHDLWLMSTEAGINQSWLEWSGGAHKYTPILNGGNPVAGASSQSVVPLVGGILALDFAKHINITESYYAPSSLGNFQLQMRLEVFNQDQENALNSGDYEILVMTVNSGVFVVERGTSSSYIGILSKTDVLDASAKQSYFFRSDVDRLVGAGLMDGLKSTVGSAMAGEGMSGAGVSGGKMKARVA